jgi:hypothetical protein
MTPPYALIDEQWSAFEERARRITWFHDDGTQCHEHLNDQLTPGGGQWWCTTHEQHLTGYPKPLPSLAPMVDLDCCHCPTCRTLEGWGPAISGGDYQRILALTERLTGTPRLRRALPPGTRWWCAPAVDLSCGPVGQRICATCFNSAPGEEFVCSRCMNRHCATTRKGDRP